MNFLKKISPSFLNRFDEYLRINHSWIWATRIHYNTYLAILLSLFFLLLSFLYRMDLTDVVSRYQLSEFFGLLFVPATIFWLYIIYNMALFNPDKSSGYRFRYREFFVFLIYFFNLSLPLLIAYPPSIVLNNRIANMVTDHELVANQNTYCYGVVFFPLTHYDYQYYPSDSAYLERLRLMSIYDRLTAEEKDELQAQSHFRSEMKDSIFWHRGVFEKQRPKLYYSQSVAFSYRHNFVQSRIDRKAYMEELVTDSVFQLYVERVNVDRDPDIALKGIRGMKELLSKYYGDALMDERTILSNFENNVYYSSRSKNLNDAIHDVRRNISNIQGAKFRHSPAFEWEVFVGLIVFIFCLTLLFQLFKNIHWKQLILAIAVSGLLITVLFVMEIMIDTQGHFLISAAAFLPIVFLFLSYQGYSIRKFSWPLNQINIMLNLVLPFYPVIVLFYLDEIHDILRGPYFDQYKEYYTAVSGNTQWRYTEEYYLIIHRIWLTTFWSGLILYVLVWNSYLKSLYLRYWSLPKPK